MFQYGLLQPGQTVGSRFMLRGLHSCLQRLQRYPCNFTFGMGSFFHFLRYYVKCIIFSSIFILKPLCHATSLLLKSTSINFRFHHDQIKTASVAEGRFERPTLLAFLNLQQIIGSGVVRPGANVFFPFTFGRNERCGFTSTLHNY